MPNLPSSCAYLAKAGVLPRVIQEALNLYGTLEVQGSGNNPAIMKWAKELGIRDYNMDSIPWCGLFAAIVCARAGKDIIDGPLWARNWAKFGVKSEKASLGDVLVFSRGGSGHVGFYVGESPTSYFVLGGNQSDKVCVTEIAKTRCIAVRSPVYNNPPASRRPYNLTSLGKLSTNEA